MFLFCSVVLLSFPDVWGQDTLYAVNNTQKPNLEERTKMPEKHRPSSPAQPTICFPIQNDNVYKVYKYIINLNDPKVIKQYRPLFDKYNYEFTGYVWEGVLKAILDDAEKNISNSVIFRCDKNIVAIKITRYETMTSFPKYICPLISNMTTFEGYLKKMNRGDINNY